MSYSFLEKTSYGEGSIGKRKRSTSPVFSDCDSRDWSDFRTCDLCMEPQKPDDSPLCGRLITYVNADKDKHLRHLAELALILYNDKKLESFRLVKVCKANCGGAGYYYLTFRAHEDGSDECLLFRGVVRVVGGEKALSCEIKEDDEVTLLIDDDDYYVCSKPALESEEHPPSLTEN